jgi:hypothetical protein
MESDRRAKTRIPTIMAADPMSVLLSMTCRSRPRYSVP